MAAAALPARAQSTMAQSPPTFLNDRERQLLLAITARLIPADEHSPSAADAGAVDFIDRQLAGPFGQGGRTYTQGPFAHGTPEQGFQDEMQPAALYRAGLARFDAVVAAEGVPFDQLPPEKQDDVLHRMEQGKLDLSPIAAKTLFGTLLANTIEGFLSDPIYGGNKGMVGWRMIGFPGAHAAYLEDVERHNEPYQREPVSVAAFLGQAPMKM